MTQYHITPESHLLVILGEVRGDVKGIVRSQIDLKERLDDLEERLYDHIKQVDQTARSRMSSFDERLGNLESFRMKAAGFVLAVSMISALVGAKLPTILKIIVGG